MGIQIQDKKIAWAEFLLPYKFAVDELFTKFTNIKSEFHLIKRTTPIEHVKRRVKTPMSIVNKLERKRLPVNIESAREHIQDIAGIRIICPFITDIYLVYEHLLNLHGIRVIQTKDCIKNPKANRYQSLHIIVQVPISRPHGVEWIYAEIQLRTMAMDFWASLEHIIYYKFDKKIPDKLLDDLHEAALVADQLDKKMLQIRNEVQSIKDEDVPYPFLESSLTI